MSDGPDLLEIGASDTSAGAGAAHLLVGPVVATHETGDTVFTSYEAGARLGAAVVLADIDGDGIADAILGATGSNAGGPGSGAVYVFYGPLTKPIYNTAIADLVLQGDAGRGLGGAIQAQDLDGDGYSELILAQNGTIWVVSGQGR